MRFRYLLCIKLEGMFKSIKKVKKKIRQALHQKEIEIPKSYKINLLIKSISQLKEYFLEYCPHLITPELKTIM